MTQLPQSSPVEAHLTPPSATAEETGQPTTGKPATSQPAAVQPSAWPAGAAELAVELQRQLSISDRDWHALKSQRARRGAEQLAASLVLLLNSDSPHRREPSAARRDAIALVEHALSWLRAEISDPGCPSHHRQGQATGADPAAADG